MRGSGWKRFRVVQSRNITRICDFQANAGHWLVRFPAPSFERTLQELEQYAQSALACPACGIVAPNLEQLSAHADEVRTYRILFVSYRISPGTWKDGVSVRVQARVTGALRSEVGAATRTM